MLPKHILITVFIVSVVSQSSLSSSSSSPKAINIGKLFQEFFEVINGNEIVELLSQKLAEGDPDMLRIASFVNSSDFKAINDHMWQSEDFVKLYHWLVNKGLRLDLFYDWLYNFLNWGNFNPGGIAHSRQQDRSLSSLYAEIRAIIPVERVLAWGIEELALGQDMMVLLNRLQNDSTRKAWDHLYTNHEFQKVRCILLDEGFPVREDESIWCAFLDWHNCPDPQCIMPHVTY